MWFKVDGSTHDYTGTERQRMGQASGQVNGRAIAFDLPSFVGALFDYQPPPLELFPRLRLPERGRLVRAARRITRGRWPGRNRAERKAFDDWYERHTTFVWASFGTGA